MKRKILSLVMAASLLPSWAMAAGKHPMAGCGLAYMLFAKDNSKGMQILASTTNNSYGTQTFGITSGTSGCTEDGAMAMNKEVEVFVEVNLDNLRHDMARGEGAYVTAFASLLGAKKESIPALAKVFQTEYQTLFPTLETTSAEFLSTLSEKLADHSDLLS